MMSNPKRYVVLDSEFNFYDVFLSNLSKSDFSEKLYDKLPSDFYYILDYDELSILNKTKGKYFVPEFNFRFID